MQMDRVRGPGTEEIERHIYDKKIHDASMGNVVNRDSFGRESLTVVPLEQNRFLDLEARIERQTAVQLPYNSSRGVCNI